MEAGWSINRALCGLTAPRPHPEGRWPHEACEPKPIVATFRSSDDGRPVIEGTAQASNPVGRIRNGPMVAPKRGRRMASAAASGAHLGGPMDRGIGGSHPYDGSHDLAACACAKLATPGRPAPMNRASFGDPRGQPAEAGAR